MKNNSVCKENRSNVFRKEREQYHEIQDLKAQIQDKNIAISELKKLIENCKGKSVKTQFDKPSVVRQPNAQRIPKPSVLGKPTPFSNSPEMRSFQTKQSVNKTNVSDGLFKQVTQQNLPQIRKQAVRNTNSRSSPPPVCSLAVCCIALTLASSSVSSSNDFDHKPFRTWNSPSTANERQGSKLVPKVVPSSSQDRQHHDKSWNNYSTITLAMLRTNKHQSDTFSIHNDEDGDVLLSKHQYKLLGRLNGLEKYFNNKVPYYNVHVF
ncbi:hypothetical protein Tco_0903134 [Tanacetum coccineum]